MIRALVPTRTAGRIRSNFSLLLFHSESPPMSVSSILPSALRLPLLLVIRQEPNRKTIIHREHSEYLIKSDFTTTSATHATTTSLAFYVRPQQLIHHLPSQQS